METRVIQDSEDLDLLFSFLRRKQTPYTVAIKEGVKRSLKQNKLQRKWCLEIAEQLGDRTAEEVRGYCKLHFGIAILKEDDDFAEKYDKVIKPLTYEQKLMAMQVPLDFPVTRLMSVKQKKQYLDDIYAHFTGEGIILTEP